MPRTNITEFSNVASENTDINSVNIAENCPASGINNALRELMKALKDVDTGSQALTALSVTGETTLASHLNMGDNDKIKLGASGDLEVYHDGSNSFVDDTGTGNLFLRGESQVIIGNMTGEQAAVFNDDGAVTLNHDNSAKLATTSSGVTVTGTLNATSGLQVNGSALVTGKVLQVVESSITGTATTSSNSFVQAHSLNITPSSSSNKIFITTSMSYNLGGTNTTGEFEFELRRDSTGIANTTAKRESGSIKRNASEFVKLDTPNTTSQVTYSINIRRSSGSDGLNYCEGGERSTMVAMEIAG